MMSENTQPRVVIKPARPTTLEAFGKLRQLMLVTAKHVTKINFD